MDKLCIHRIHRIRTTDTSQKKQIQQRELRIAYNAYHKCGLVTGHRDLTTKTLLKGGSAADQRRVTATLLKKMNYNAYHKCGLVTGHRDLTTNLTNKQISNSGSPWHCTKQPWQQRTFNSHPSPLKAVTARDPEVNTCPSKQIWI